MITAKQRLYGRLAINLAPRFRPRIWRNCWRYARSIRDVRKNGPDHLPYTPLSAVIWVTNRCNKDCPFCQYADDLNAKNHREFELTFARFKELIHLPTTRNCLRIGLYGGEPLLNADLPRMIQYGKERGHFISVNTNGLLIKKRLSALLETPPDLIAMGYYPEDRAKTDEAISLIAPHVPVLVNYMYSEARLGELEAVVESSARHGARAVVFESYEPQGMVDDCAIPAAGESNQPIGPNQVSRRNAEIPIAPDDTRIEVLKRDLQRRYGKRIFLAWPAKRSRGAKGTATCRTFWHSTWLDAKGQMSPCCVWPAAAFEGNLFDGTASWNSPRMIKLREAMRRNAYPRICAACSHLNDDLLGL